MFVRASAGTGSFNFRFQLAAPKSIPEPAVLQLEVYLDARPQKLNGLINLLEIRRQQKGGSI